MKDNNDRDIPYVSKELCVYLRDAFSLQNCLSQDRHLNEMKGINHVLEYLEAIQWEQEERHGIHR